MYGSVDIWRCEIFSVNSIFFIIKYSNFRGGNGHSSALLPNSNIARILCHVKGALVLRALILPLQLAGNLCYLSLPSYVIDNSP